MQCCSAFSIQDYGFLASTPRNSDLVGLGSCLRNYLPYELPHDADAVIRRSYFSSADLSGV